MLDFNLLELDLNILFKHIEFSENCIEQLMVYNTGSLDVAPNTNTYSCIHIYTKLFIYNQLIKYSMFLVSL